MSSFLINIRIWIWHFIVDLNTKPHVYISRNRFHIIHDWPDGYVSVYDGKVILTMLSIILILIGFLIF